MGTVQYTGISLSALLRADRSTASTTRGAIDICSLFVHNGLSPKEAEMSGGGLQLLLLAIAAAGATIAALFAILCLRKVVHANWPHGRNCSIDPQVRD